MLEAGNGLTQGKTEPEEKAERFELMQTQGISESEAAIAVARRIGEARGISNSMTLKGET